MKYIKAWFKFVGVSWMLYGVSVGLLETATALADNKKAGKGLLTCETRFTFAIVDAFRNFKKIFAIFADMVK